MLEDIKCIICNHNAKMVLKDFKGYQEGEHFNIYYCASCNTSFVWPHLVDNKIYDCIYSQSDVIPGYNRYALFAKEITGQKSALDYLADKEAMYFAIKEILARNSDKTIKILEVGSGLGYLTYAIAREGYDITGLDISIDAVKKAEEKFGKHFICEDVYQYSKEHSNEFDIVILTEVIEHVPDPTGFCNCLVSLLKKDGKLIITTPNKSAYPPHDDYWYTEAPPVHLTWFSEDSFKVIAEQGSFKISFFDFARFNKKHIDAPRFKYHKSVYRLKNRDSTLNREGKVVAPLDLTVTTRVGKLKAALKKFFKSIVEPLFITFLTDKKNPHRNGILCVILQKNT